MSEQPEPLSAILAEFRADIPAMTSGELPHPTPEYLRILLDRIEADEARAAFEAEHSRGIVRNLYTATFAWLFATAKGGDHA